MTQLQLILMTILAVSGRLFALPASAAKGKGGGFGFLSVLCIVIFLSGCSTPGDGAARTKQWQAIEARSLQLCEEKGFNPDSAQFANCVKDTGFNLLLCRDAESRNIVAGFSRDETLEMIQTMFPSEKCQE